jgi:hypothetical protein
MFLKLNFDNLPLIKKNSKNVLLHQKCFGIDLNTSPTQEKLNFINILKEQFYLIALLVAG